MVVLIKSRLSNDKDYLIYGLKGLEVETKNL